MDIVLASKLVAVIGAIGVLIWFVIIANVHSSKHDPFFAGKGLNSPQIRANLAATATSLAGVLFFFMENTALFGWVLLLVPLFNAAGFFVFLKVVERSENDPAVTGSVFRFMRNRFDRRRPGAIAHIIIAINLVAIFIVEIVIGTTILGYIIDGLTFQLAFALLLGMVAFYYVMKGGFFAVTQTDRWQYFLILIGFSFAGIALLAFGDRSSISMERTFDIFSNPELGFTFQIAVIFNIIVTNLSIPSTQIGTWERFSSTSREQAIDGFKRGIQYFLIPLWFLAIGVSVLVIQRTNGAGTGFTGLFDALIALGPIASLIIFPMVFVALMAALLSTIDSFMIASMLAIHDLTGKEKSSPPTDDDLSEQRRTMFKTGLFLVVAAVGMTWVVAQSDDILRTVTQLLFATYGMPCLLFPMIWMAGRAMKPATIDLGPAYWGLGAGIAVLLGGSFHGMATGLFYGTILGPVAGVVLAAIGAAISNNRKIDTAQGA